MSTLYYLDNLKYLGEATRSLKPNKLDDESLNVIVPGDILLVSSEFQTHIFEKIIECQKLGAIVVHIPDGIMEWRNSFEHPPSDLEGMGNQVWNPIVSDYFVAMGDAQARLLASLGAKASCCVLGSPRYDSMISHYLASKWDTGVKTEIKVLVASARKFSLGLEDGRILLNAFDDIKGYFASQERVSKFRFKPIWRVDERLMVELNLSDKERCSGQGDLSELLKEVDVVLTSPSSLMLEGMLFKKPVICLDYTSSPHYVRAAWNIKNKSHIHKVMTSLYHIQQSRIRFQEAELADQLQLEDGASLRLKAFIESLVSGKAFERSPTPKPVTRELVTVKDAEIAQLKYQLRQEREASSLRLGRLYEYDALLRKRILDMEKSVSWKLGRLLAWPAKKIYDLIFQR